MTNQAVTILLVLVFIWTLAVLWLFADAYRRGKTQRKAKGRPMSNMMFLVGVGWNALLGRYSALLAVYARAILGLSIGLILMTLHLEQNSSFSSMQSSCINTIGAGLIGFGLFNLGMMFIVMQRRKSSPLTEESEEKSE